VRALGSRNGVIADAQSEGTKKKGGRASMLVEYSLRRRSRILRAHSADAVSTFGLGGDCFFCALA